MGRWRQPPFALFPLVDIPTEVIDSLLKQGEIGSGIRCFWLPNSESYTDTPRRIEGKVQEGTEFPISKSYKSPFVGRKLEDVAEWIRNKPAEVDVDEHHFAILDLTAKDGKIVNCRVGGTHLDDMKDLDWYRDEADMAGMVLMAMTAYKWEENRDIVGGKPEIKY